MKAKCFRMAIVILLVVVANSSIVSGGYLKAPPGMFKDLNDQILGDAIIINGKQLFIDDHIIGEIKVSGAWPRLLRIDRGPGSVTLCGCQ